MARWGLVIDLDRCTGCQACVIACKHENNVPFSTPTTAAADRLMTWIWFVAPELPERRRPLLPLMCRHCMNACPYGVKAFNWTTPEWPDSMVPMANPHVSRRPNGVVEKCTFCHHRLIQASERARAEGRELAPGDYVPACVEICPTDAMAFGDLDDPSTHVADLALSPRAFRLLEELGTRPK